MKLSRHCMEEYAATFFFLKSNIPATVSTVCSPDFFVPESLLLGGRFGFWDYSGRKLFGPLQLKRAKA